MKIHLYRALGVGVIFVLAFYAFQILQGMFLTMNYVPKVVD